MGAAPAAGLGSAALMPPPSPALSSRLAAPFICRRTPRPTLRCGGGGCARSRPGLRAASPPPHPSPLVSEQQTRGAPAGRPRHACTPRSAAAPAALQPLSHRAWAKPAPCPHDPQIPALPVPSSSRRSPRAPQPFTRVARHPIPSLWPGFESALPLPVPTAQRPRPRPWAQPPPGSPFSEAPRPTSTPFLD